MLTHWNYAKIKDDFFKMLLAFILFYTKIKRKSETLPCEMSKKCTAQSLQILNSALFKFEDSSRKKFSSKNIRPIFFNVLHKKFRYLLRKLG